MVSQSTLMASRCISAFSRVILEVLFWVAEAWLELSVGGEVVRHLFTRVVSLDLSSSCNERQGDLTMTLS